MNDYSYSDMADSIELEDLRSRVNTLAEANASLRTENRALRAAVRDLEKMLDIVKGSK